MKVLSIIGAIWCVLFLINIIITLIYGIIQKKNLNKFKDKIKNSGTLEEIFNKLTPEQIDQLNKGKEVKEKIEVIKRDNTDPILSKYKDCEIKDIEKFLNKLHDWLVKTSNNIKADIKDWYRIESKELDKEMDVTFEVMANNVFAVFAYINDENKIVSNICGFKEIEDLEELLKTGYKMDKLIREEDYESENKS